MGEHTDNRDAPRANKSGREVELKLRVDDMSGLLRVALSSGGTPEPTAHQTNAFFDTPDRVLGTKGLVVRVREERVGPRTVWYVTAKGPGHRNGSLTSVAEEEVEVDATSARAMVAGQADPIGALEGGGPARQVVVDALRNALGGRPLTLLGKFQNERTRVPVVLEAEGVRFEAVLELDRTTFPGNQIHHEVEMEVPSHVPPEVASRAFHELFHKAGVTGRVSPGKARRFFAALRGDRLE